MHESVKKIEDLLGVFPELQWKKTGKSYCEARYHPFHLVILPLADEPYYTWRMRREGLGEIQYGHCSSVEEGMDTARERLIWELEWETS